MSLRRPFNLYRLLQLLPLCLATLGAGGCAHVQVAADGQTHVLGLVWLTLPAPPVLPFNGLAVSAGQSLRVRTLGLSWLRSEPGSSLVLGWQDSTLAYLLDHRWVDADAVFHRSGAARQTRAGLCLAQPEVNP